MHAALKREFKIHIIEIIISSFAHFIDLALNGFLIAQLRDFKELSAKQQLQRNHLNQ